jgi:predicted transcriptional regulator
MARVLHVFKGPHPGEAVAVITPQVAAGDEVTVALIGGVTPPPLPAGVSVVRVPEQASYDGFLELIFAADHVVTW